MATLRDHVGDNLTRRVIKLPLARGIAHIYVGFEGKNVKLGIHCRFWSGKKCSEIDKAVSEILNISDEHIASWVNDVRSGKFDNICVYGRSREADASVWINIR